MPEKLSIVIPALNESQHLPGLLKALQEQTRPPDEIIVADAGSKDGTVELAEKAGAVVVPGGMPAVGRNAGARAAAGDLLLFLDADVLPGPDFIAAALAEFTAENLDAATCLIEPLSEHATDWLISDVTNLYLQLVQVVSPHAPGFCIFATRRIHEIAGGFAEDVVMAEDHDYVQRAARHGRFGVLTSVRIPVSVRRLEKEGVVRLAIKYLYCELHALAGRPIRSTPFVYEFGDYSKSARRFVDITWLRQKLGEIENPLGSLSERSRNTFQALGSLQLSSEVFESRLNSLLPAELASLREYLKKRRGILRMRNETLRQHLRLLHARKPFESIRLLDFDWRSLFQTQAELSSGDELPSSGEKENE